ncbi:MAG: SDR family NAD(P)-dependent oxidoreductase, partial [Burkholderiales bacterium]
MEFAPMNQRRTAIVTGSATGVGAASALALARRGYDVLINYTKSEREAKETEQACRAAGADTLCVRGDVAEDADCRGIVQAAVSRWSRLDALVNNAGVTTFVGSGNWDALDAETFQRIFAVNLLGTFQMIRASAPYLKAARGSIVNVSSIAGALGIGSSVPYVASKGAINSLTLHLARVLAPEVRVNAVCPGMITTRWCVDGVGQEAYEKLKSHFESVTPLATACTA